MVIRKEETNKPKEAKFFENSSKMDKPLPGLIKKKSIEMKQIKKCN